VPTIPAWLVIDARTLRRYGLGLIRLHTPVRLLRRHPADGYLHRGVPVGELGVAPASANLLYSDEISSDRHRLLGWPDALPMRTRVAHALRRFLASVDDTMEG